MVFCFWQHRSIYFAFEQITTPKFRKERKPVEPLKKNLHPIFER